MTRKTLERGDFRLLHYAGEVTYCVVGKRHLNVRPCYWNISTPFFFPFKIISSWLTALSLAKILGFLDKNNDLLYRNIKDVSMSNWMLIAWGSDKATYIVKLLPLDKRHLSHIFNSVLSHLLIAVLSVQKRHSQRVLLYHGSRQQAKTRNSKNSVC